MPTKSNKPAYTGKRRRLAQMLINPDFTGTVTELCEMVGVARSTFYDWMKDPEYLEYIQTQIDGFTNGEIAAVWKALIKECKEGNVAAIKLFFELKGKYEVKVNIEGTQLAAVLEQLNSDD